MKEEYIGISQLMAAYIEEEPIKNLVKAYLDVIVLAMLNGKPVHGYKIIADLHKTFGVLLSPGTLYPLLYKLEREKLIKVKEVKRRKLYNLTPYGRSRVFKVIRSHRKTSEKIFSFIDRNLECEIPAT